jgi:hypothetical protein
MRDRNSKGRQARGETHGRTTLSEATARKLLSLKPSGKTPWGFLRDISQRFELDRQVVSNIWTGKTWRHL